ncbi:uncharacterized protein AKAME5_002470400, partial [Lates japonicus]
MASTLVILLQLLLVSLVSASHNYGGSVTHSYKGRTPDGSFRVDIRERSTFDGCQYSHHWSCYTGNCGYTTRTQRGVLDRSTSAPQYNREWCETETVTTTIVRSDKPFQRRVPQNCPRTYRLMSFDPDGDQVRCRYGNMRGTECSTCNQPSGFQLDQGSCTLHYHYASASYGVFGFEMVVEDFPQSNITLAYTDGSRSHRAPLTGRRRKRQISTIAPTTTTPWWWWYTTTAAPTTTTAPATTSPWWWWYTTTAAPTTTTTPQYTTTTRQLSATTAPLSKLPLQFSLLVDPPAPSCQEGLYLPKFVSPTPANGARIAAEVNKEVEIRVKAQAAYAVIYDMIISGPLNVSKHRNTHNEFVIRWTPVPGDVGDHFPICFAVEAATGSAVASHQTTQHYHYHGTPSSQSGIYQSEMRCVLVDVKMEQVKAHVVCSESTMRVEVEKSSFSGLHEDHLRLSDPSNTACSLQRHSNSTHIIAVVPLNACGTQIEEDDENLIFKNEITTFDNNRDLITRKHLLEVQFYCKYPKRGNVSLSFTAHRKNVTVWERGFGTFTYEFEFYPDGQYQTLIDPNSYPLEYDLGSRVYMQIEATSSVNNTELFVESCRAAPYDNPNYRPTYSIIENGCKVDPTVEIHSPSHENQFKFSMEAFKFIGLHDQ